MPVSFTLWIKIYCVPFITEQSKIFWNSALIVLGNYLLIILFLSFSIYWKLDNEFIISRDKFIDGNKFIFSITFPKIQINFEKRSKGNRIKNESNNIKRRQGMQRKTRKKKI